MLNPETVAAIAMACVYGVISGFNDGGNLIASFTAGRVLTPRVAMAIFLVVPVGPLVLGSAVARTVGVAVINLPAQGLLGFTMIVLASVGVVLLSWHYRVPTSMTLALVGAMLGWVLGDYSANAIYWPGIAKVIIGMVVSVVAGGLLSYLLHRLSLVLLGHRPHGQVLGLAKFQSLSACLQAFAYGANDMGKTIGLVAVAAHLSGSGAPLSFSSPLWVLFAFLSFALGTLVGGWSLAKRVGFGVVRLRPFEAMSSQLAAGVVVAGLAMVGAPVSTTQTIDGSLVGVGVGIRASEIRWGVVREMVASWVITLPAALLFGLIGHLGARVILGIG